MSPLLPYAHALLTELQPIIMLNFTGVGDPDRYDDVWTSFREAAKGSMEQTVANLSMPDLSHSFDDALLSGPPRVMNAGCVVTNLWTGLAEELWESFVTYTASSPDVADSMVALEFHATRRKHPVRMDGQLLPPMAVSPLVSRLQHRSILIIHRNLVAFPLTSLYTMLLLFTASEFLHRDSSERFRSDREYRQAPHSC